MPAPIIMVHGAFCAGWVFEAFKAPFEARGHLCLTPDLPGHGDGERGRAAGLSMSDYAAAIATLAEAQSEPPILIGHSMGALVVQLAAAKVRAKAMVLLSPSPPWGVAGGSMEEAAQAIGLLSLGAYWIQAVEPDFALFRDYSVDRMDEAAQRAAYGRLTSESGRALFETLNWWLDPLMTTSVRPALGGPPIMAACGGKDQIHSPSLAKQTADRCGATLRVFPEMSHWLTGEPGHEAVAQTVLDWLSAEARAAA
jgi:pimeloyl-ACP methyl ester carboxylesterase